MVHSLLYYASNAFIEYIYDDYEKHGDPVHTRDMLVQVPTLLLKYFDEYCDIYKKRDIWLIFNIIRQRSYRGFDNGTPSLNTLCLREIYRRCSYLSNDRTKKVIMSLCIDDIKTISRMGNNRAWKLLVRRVIAGKRKKE